MDEQGEPFGPIKNISDIFPGLPKVCLLPMLKKVLGRVVDVANMMIIYIVSEYLQKPDAGFTWHNGLTFVFKGTHKIVTIAKYEN